MTVELPMAVLYGAIVHASILGLYAGITWTMLRRHGQTLARVTELLEKHGDRLTYLEANHQVRRKYAEI